jgi:hypothetical protein
MITAFLQGERCCFRSATKHSQIILCFNFLLTVWSIRRAISKSSVRLSSSQAHNPFDLFLENRKEFEEIGKLAIAAALIPYEDYGALGISPEPRWYEILFGLMTEGGKFEDNQLSVITFNYERSLEAFLFQALQNLYGLDLAKANDLLGKIPIVHLYGSLGAGLISQNDERGYSTELKGNWVTEAAKRIKIVHEADPNTPEFEQAHHLLQGATEIIFLGFGFHPRNVERLKLPEARKFYAYANSKESRVLACRKGMGDGDVMRARKHLPACIDFAPNESWDIRKFLSNTECLSTYLPHREP